MIVAWSLFVLLVLVLLALDLGVFHRKVHVVGVREALGWSAVWISIGLLFGMVVYFGYDRHWFGLGLPIDAVDGIRNTGRTALIKYLTGYVVEKSLSVDNVFVIALVFSSFGVPPLYQHRVLFWGILGALVLRGAMIALGAVLIAKFHWVLYVFGAFLIYTGIRMLRVKHEMGNPGEVAVVRLTRRFFPVTSRYHGSHFAVKAGTPAASEGKLPGDAAEADPELANARPGMLVLTPLALALVVVEFTDLVFAVDSIPAIFAITADPFLVFTSNVFAILGLRSLYFALAGLLGKFRYLKVALATVLMLVGGKMLAASWLKEVVGKNYSLMLLALILAVLAAGVIGSMIADRRERGRTAP